MFNSRVKITFLLVLLGAFYQLVLKLKEARRTIGHTSRDARKPHVACLPALTLMQESQIYDRTEAH